MKVRILINTQIEYIGEISDEDFKLYNKEKAKGKTIINNLLNEDLNADKIFVKSYRIVKEDEDE